MLAEQHDDWAEGRRCLGLSVLARSRVDLVNTNDTTTEKDRMRGAVGATIGELTSCWPLDAFAIAVSR